MIPTLVIWRYTETMSVVNILNIQVLDNPTRFTNPFQFEITFECISPLNNGAMSVLCEDLEWKVVYVGSAEDEKHDQTLDTIMVGPIPVGINKFVFQVLLVLPSQADPPSWSKIPVHDIVGVTVVLLICAYNGQEFVRVGYYVNNEYDEEELKANPPESILVDRIVRNILSDKPRVTRVPIKWDTTTEIEDPPTESFEDAESKHADHAPHARDFA